MTSLHRENLDVHTNMMSKLKLQSPLIPEPYPTSTYCWGSGGDGGRVSSKPIRLNFNLQSISSQGTSAQNTNTNTNANANTSTKHSNKNEPTNRQTANVSSISKVYCGCFGSTAITSNGEVYSWGTGDDHSSMVSSTSSSSSSSSSSSVSFPLGRKCTTLSNRCTPKKIITLRGEQSLPKQQKRQRKQQKQKHKQQRQEPISIQKVAHGEHHTILLCENGDTLAFGDATDGKLGIRRGGGGGGRQRGMVELPVQFDPIMKNSNSNPDNNDEEEGSCYYFKCIDVACGYSSSHFLLEEHVIQSKAGERDTDIGGSSSSSSSAAATCRRIHSHANKTIVVSHGLTGYNYNSVSGGIQRRVLPTTLHCPVAFVSISSGSHHCAAISSQGGVYTWGIADNGRLGHGHGREYGHGDEKGEEKGDEILDTASSQHEPRIIEYFQEHGIVAKKIVCGSAHNIVLTNDTCEMYAFGWNMYGQCGIGTKGSNCRSGGASRSRNGSGSGHRKRMKDVFLPTKVEYQADDNVNGGSDGIGGVTNIGPVMDISCGFAHSAAISSNGKLFCWGYNECGQVGIGTEGGTVHSPKLVTFDEGGAGDDYMRKSDYTYCITNVSCGKTHSVAVLSHCSIFQYLERQHEIEATKNAIPTLRRFVRYSLFRIRLLQIVCQSRDNQKKNDAVSASSSMTEPSTPGSPECIEDNSITSECSTYSDWSYDFEEEPTERPKLEESKPIYTSRITELMNMKDEDITSMAFSRDCEERIERLREKKLLILTETVRREEVTLMCREDIMSYQVRKHRNAAKNELLKQRQAARLQERNARVQQQIQKETERMRNTKKKQESAARPRRKMTMVPRVTVSTHRKSYRKNLEMSASTRNTPLLPSRSKNRKLLIQRRERLQRLERERAEEAMRQKKATQEEHARHLRMKEDAKKTVLKKIEEVNAMRRKESVKHMLAFVKMKEDINPQHPENNGESPSKKKDKFMSLRQWHRELAVD